ncbi:MAG: hypothetical protein U1C96_12470 [Gallionella sp.]|nr:hypothetical protein [Gallionella sp.]
MPLMQRLVGWAGLAMIAGGYVLIMSSAGLPEGDVQAVARVVGTGMTLVIVGGVIEVLVLMGWARG